VRNARHSGLQSLKDIASEDERFRAETEVGVLQAHCLHRGAKAAAKLLTTLNRFHQFLSTVCPALQLQKLTDKHIQLAEQLGADKAKDIRIV
jgi:hypothetical protein